MNIPTKPHTPEEVYESGILHHTIVDYHWIAPGDPIFNPGWFPIKVLNYEHPKLKKELEEMKKKAELSLGNKEVNWKRLSGIYITI